MTNKTVRPIMTVEARDYLDAVHSTKGMETRSESIVEYLKDCVKIHKANERLEAKLSIQKQRTLEYKVLSGLMTAACVALVATMMISAS